MRHGAARRTRGRCVGHCDVPLSARGRAEMRELGRRLAARWPAPPGAMTASDLRRAADSLELLAASWGHPAPFAHPAHPAPPPPPLVLEPRLRELSFGLWEGRRWEEIEHSDPVRFRSWTERWVTHGPPGGESFADLVRRAASWLDELRARGSAGRHLVVAHAGSIRALLAHTLGWPAARALATPIGHCRLTIIDLTAGRARLRALDLLPRPVSLSSPRRSAPPAPADRGSPAPAP